MHEAGEPPARTLADEIRALKAADEAKRQARADSVTARKRQDRDWAEELHPQVVTLINEVLAMPDATSLWYELCSRHERFRGNAKPPADPVGIGTRASDDLLREGRAGWVCRSKFTDIWPALDWLAGWGIIKDPDWGDKTVHLSGSLWFNRSGMVIAGRQRHPDDGILEPTSRRHIPFPNIFGPISIRSLAVEHLLQICTQVAGDQYPPHSRRKPELPRALLSRVIAGHR